MIQTEVADKIKRVIFNSVSSDNRNEMSDFKIVRDKLDDNRSYRGFWHIRKERSNKAADILLTPIKWHAVTVPVLTFRHRASCIVGQAFHYSPENALYIFNQQIYFII